MNVLVTGDCGLVGRAVVAELRAQGDTVSGFDRVRGQDVLDRPALRAAVAACEAVVHLAAIDPDATGPFGTANAADALQRPEDVLRVNALGTQFVLEAAARAEVQRVVFMSSVDTLGIFMGERAPDYLPIDDDHPTYARAPYALAKALAEDMCRAFTADSGIPSICLRPPGIFDDAMYGRVRAAREATPEIEWSPVWEYGAFIDVRDVATAVACALRCPDPGHCRLLLCADDISSAQLSSRQLVDRLLPAVPWRGSEAYEQDPFRALVNTHLARQVLGWAPRHRWRGVPSE